MKNNQYNKLFIILKPCVSKIVFRHSKSVFVNTRNFLKVITISKKNRKIVLTAAIFHDICKGEFDHGKKGSILVKSLLTNYSKKDIKKVSYLIKYHQKSKPLPKKYKKLILILRLADSL